MLNNYKNVIFFAIAVGALYAGYSYFYGGATSDTITTVEITPGASGEGELIGLLQKIESIRLDTAIFSDPVYRSLADFAQTLSPEPTGRPNPFAPIGNRVAPVVPPSGGVNNVFTR